MNNRLFDRNTIRPYVIIASILLFISGFLFWESIFGFFTTLIKYEYIGFGIIGRWWMHGLKTGVTLGVIPLTFYYTWKFNGLKTISSRFTSSIVIIATTSLILYLKLRWINPSDLIENSFTTPHGANLFVDDSQMNALLYIIIGLIIGAFITTAFNKLITFKR